MKSEMNSAKNAIPLLVACISVFALGQFQRASGSVFGPVLTETLSIPATALGVLVAAMFAATLVSQAPAGVALDRFGPRHVLLYALALVALGTALFAIAPDLNNGTWPTLILARVLIGAGLAATGASVQMALAQNLPSGDYGYASGLLVTLGGIGGLVGTWPLAVALESFSWRLVFGVGAGLAVFVMIIVSTLLPDAKPASPDHTHSDISFFALLRGRKLRGVLCLGAVTYAPIVTITGLWGGPYLQDVHGLSPETSGQALMGLFATTIAAGFVFGRIDRIGRGRSGVVLLTALGSATCLVTLALLPSPPVWAALILMGGSVFLQQFYIPLGVQLRDAVPAAAFGRANALKLLIATGAIPVMQTAFGLVLDLARGIGVTEENAFQIAFGCMAAVIGAALIGYWNLCLKADTTVRLD
ncbi:MFS transporter [Thalassobius sp. Cn5-15]|uniref:MFS transporter n=1 Tax=Thalassobius sp. Cn5-15 TaxID=2917763 RepID=UPI001EF34ACD|nr:MFS transporter [Thalassobius sp. Cn5-15]MCG7492779.1 MFS transporter [Thalassobius sp. Cn5-15]